MSDFICTAINCPRTTGGCRRCDETAALVGPKVYTLAPDEWDAFMDAMRNPAPPTQSIREGAELLRRLYGKKS